MKKELDTSIEKRIRRVKAYLDEELNETELNEFRGWLDESPANRRLLERVQNERLLWEKINFCERNDLQKGWNDIQKKIHGKRFSVGRFLRYAVALVIIISLGGIVYRNLNGTDVKEQTTKQPIITRGGYKACLELATGERLLLDSLSQISAEVKGAIIRAKDKGTIVVDENEDSLIEQIEYNRVIVPKGGEYKIVLADGSQVWINSFSELEFPAQFGGKERRVRLCGEAYFEVRKDEEKPFVVEVMGREVQVLGTSFNVNCYNEKLVTTLVTGKVDVLSGERHYLLTPGMQFREEGGSVSLSNVDVREFTAWKDGWFVFKNQRLQDVLDILSRWYDVEVFYQNPGLQDLHFTGTIKRHSDIAEVLKFLEKTDMMTFNINGRTLIISK